MDKSNSKHKSKRRRAVIVYSGPSTSTSTTNSMDHSTPPSDSEQKQQQQQQSSNSFGNNIYTDISSSSSDDSEVEFRPAKKVKKPKSPPTPKPVETKNKFDVLSDTDSNNSTLQKDPEPKQITPPPVFIKNITSWKNTAHAIRMANIQVKSSRTVSDAIRVQPTTVIDYRKIQDLLSKLNIEFYSFRLKKEKPLQVVIRGLPSSVTCEEVLEELKLLKFPVQNAYYIGRAKSLMVVHLDRTEEARKIYDLTELMYLKIKVEGKHRSRLPGQCHRCQNFGHSSSACHLQWRCVRCGEHHATFECDKKNKEQFKPRCANCNEEHTANYKGCIGYQLAVDRKLATTSARVQPSKSFADVLKGTPSSPPPTSAPAPSVMQRADNSTPSTSLTNPPRHQEGPKFSVRKSKPVERSSSKIKKPIKPAKKSNSNSFDWIFDLLKNLNITSICGTVNTLISKLALPPNVSSLIQLALGAVPTIFNAIVNACN